jgi:hypothetical protein
MQLCGTRSFEMKLVLWLVSVCKADKLQDLKHALGPTIIHALCLRYSENDSLYCNRARFNGCQSLYRTMY